MVPYFIEQPSALKRYALEFLLRTCGYTPREVASPLDAILYYGNAPVSGRMVVIPYQDPASVSFGAIADTPGLLPVDVVGATAALLTDTVNRGRTDVDVHDRLRFASSQQAETSQGYLPLVSHYVSHIKRLLTPLVGPGIPLWPEGKKAVVGLSHDVDRLDKWSEVRGSIRTGRHRVDAARSVLRNAIRSNRDGELFRDVVDYERSLGFKSTFMFATTSRYDRDSSPYDVAYSIGSPIVRGVMGYMQERGFEVGLHASYNAYRSADSFAEEKSRLEKVAGSQVNGLRHHFWHIGRDVDHTFSCHEKSGFLYDSSVAWNEQLGYRRSTASPYFPWHSTDQREIRVWQIPVFAMDGNLFYEPGMSVACAVDRLLSAVKQLSDCGGVGVVDWHSDTSHPATPGYELWGRCYWEFLRRLSEMSELWITNLGEIAVWVQDRDRRLRSE